MNTLFAYLIPSNPLGLLVIAGIVLLLFGNRLPSVMRSLGRSVVEFKKGTQEIADESSAEETPKSKEKV
jgi:sec-independent protein translocase protein TatA